MTQEIGKSQMPARSETAEACRLYEQALSCFGQGRFEEAERLCRRSLGILDRVEEVGLDSLRLRVRSLGTLADACRALGRYDEAETIYRRALDLVDAVLGHDHLEAAGLYLGLARLELARGRAADGEAPARWGLAIRERALGPDHPDVAADKATLAAILEAQGR